MLLRRYPGWKLDSVSSRADLEHSCSPVYTRGVLRQGQSAFAVLGVNAEETQPSIDAALTFGILWMHRQREQLVGRAHVAGLKLFVPSGRSEIIRQRMAHLDRDAAKWQLYELDKRAESCSPLDCADSGNIVTRLVRAVDALPLVPASPLPSPEYKIIPDRRSCVESPSEIVFRLHGLEFARASRRLCRLIPQRRSHHLRTLARRVHARRIQRSEVPRTGLRVSPSTAIRTASHGDPFFRICPERWLESLIIRDVRAIDERLDQRFVYSQVPAFASSDRAMIEC